MLSAHIQKGQISLWLLLKFPVEALVKVTEPGRNRRYQHAEFQRASLKNTPPPPNRGSAEPYKLMLLNLHRPMLKNTVPLMWVLQDPYF